MLWVDKIESVLLAWYILLSQLALDFLVAWVGEHNLIFPYDYILKNVSKHFTT